MKNSFFYLIICFGSLSLVSVRSQAQWIQSSGPCGAVVNSIAVSGSNIFAGTYGAGVFLSTNNGSTWTATNAGLMNPYAYANVVSGTNLFVGTWGGGVFLSTNNGAGWTAVNSGSKLVNVHTLASSGTDLFAGTIRGGGVWRRPLSEMPITTSAEELSASPPTHFNLSQNYPNPFNPATTIAFGLPSASFVSLKLFDIVGREVAALVCEVLSAGSYVRQWNAEGLPSGVYLYRLSARAISGGPDRSFVETKKLILLR